MFSVSSERPIEPLTLAVLQAVDELARNLGFPYFVAGAMARDILLTGVFGINTGRATKDVDFAVAVQSWEHFEAIKAGLVERGSFTADPKAKQRLNFTPAPQSSGYPLDLIPFRGVETPPSNIAWPPDMDVVMNVAGYEEALETSQLVQAAPGLIVRVVSLPGLALLKLLAWSERGEENSKDALDLATLLGNYEFAGNRDRIYENPGILEVVDYDLALAAARLLGADMNAIASPGTRVQIRALFDDAIKMDRLALHMTRGLVGNEDGLEKARRFLEQFKSGASDELPQQQHFGP